MATECTPRAQFQSVQSWYVLSVSFLRKEIACTKLLFGFQMGIEVGGMAQFENLKIYILSKK